MKKRKILVLGTLAVFLLSVGCLGLYRAILSPRPMLIMPKDYPSIGSPNAPVEVVVFEDFLCHTCRYFTMEVFPAIESTYVDPGIAQYVMIPLGFSAHSKEVANAALAVFHQAPQYYFYYVRELFSLFAEGKLEFDDLVNSAAKLQGIDLNAFKESVKTGRYNQELDRNLEVAKKAMKKNLRTPAVFINGYAMPGISFESISLKIEEILKLKEKE